ncbi:MAG TPA: M56 family metallopeptidase [Thermoanaerobaculia bacterium]|jgi:beta-lactamase regulating signal transducer with metallopeptidase domain|nr:M56 family metallopeptidase [Thermoanaerobaculia bacterium]
MNSMELLTGPLAQAIGWALLHLLWQATIVAGILAAVLALMKRQSANTRYVVSCGALALVFAMFVATTIRAYDPAAEPIAITSEGAATPATMKVPLTQLPVLIAESAAEGLRDRALAAAVSARNKLPSIVAIWLAGVVLLSARLLVSWMRAKRLIHHGTRPASNEWQRIAAHLSNALGLRRAVTLLESAAVEVPSVIGSLRPIILLPASALTGMTPEQIEMVLAHEMAHIRRHDFLINLLQALVETLMFYHPAVWWMSRRVRIERENCCDDLAVAVCGNPIQYARALTRLEELRGSALSVVVAANGGSLLERIRRIAAGRAEGTTSSSRWAAAVAMLSILIIAIAVPSLPALAERQEKKKTEDTAKKAEAKVEVVEAREDAAAPDDPDVDIEPDVDWDYDYEYDHDPGDFTPEPPDVPLPVIPPYPPVAIRSLTPRPMVAIAPMAIVPPVPGVPTPAPDAPMAMAAIAAHDFEFEYEHDTDETKDRELGSGGKLTVDELISLRASGVTPEYVNTMRGFFPGLTLRQVTSLSAMGVNAAFIKEMRDSGFDVKTAREATSLKAVGVTPEYVKDMRAAGFQITSARDASSMAAVGVTPEYVREMRAAGFEIKTAKDATSMKAVGVTPEYVQQMRAAGFEIKTAKDATSLSAVGVDPSWVRDMRAAGVKIESARDASNLKAVGVTPEFVKKLAAAGYSNLSPRELSRLAAAGVDDDFIREMEQYRKKN